jgi:hypothetical protein
MNNLCRIMICFIILSGTSHGATVEALTLKANFVVKFIPFIEFPVKHSAYRVGFMGKKEHFQEFKDVFHGKTHDNAKFEVFGLGPKSDLSDIDILFIEANAFPEKINEIKALIISDEKSGLDKGANINFLIVGESIKFEINQLKSQEGGFKISSRLLNLALRVVQ